VVRARTSLVVAAVLLLAACNGNGGDAADTTTTTAPDDTTTSAAPTTTSLEDEVIRDYEAANAALSAAGNPPNPNHPDLLRYWTGDALAFMQSRLTQLQANNVGAENTVETHPVVRSLSGDTAQLDDCFVDHTQLINLATNEPVGDPGTTTQNAEVQMQRGPDVWQIAVQTVRDEPCTPG
jgi:hypothetical protein